ncbi:Selenoprotein W [Schistosoma japonicum]|nr:Selenoprotein W [Schistosoma japonicum]
MNCLMLLVVGYLAFEETDLGLMRSKHKQPTSIRNVPQALHIFMNKLLRNIPCTKACTQGSLIAIHGLESNGHYYNSFKQQLERRFPGKLEISGEGTPQSTGWFEVQVVDGPLLHSKKNGDGYVDNKKLERICEAIRDLL